MEARLTAVESNMEVRLLQRPKRRIRQDQLTYATKRHFVRIILYSDVRKTKSGHLSSRIDIETGPHFRRRVEAAGGSLAEYQNGRYGDQHDPSQCARVAKELVIDLLRHVK